MACRLCQWLCNLRPGEAGQLRASFWSRSSDWERAHSNDWDLWSGQSDEARALIDRADAIEDSDPEAALRLYAEAADAGSAWAMETVGWRYDAGIGTARDRDCAAEYYRRAFAAGSQVAAIGYAALLIEQGDRAGGEAILIDSARSGFVPAYYRLALHRYEGSPSRRTYREIMPWLEYAAEMGHPGAQLRLAELMAAGRCGLRKVPKGLRLLAEVGFGLRAEAQAGPGESRGAEPSAATG